jgi:hypothetical protein
MPFSPNCARRNQPFRTAALKTFLSAVLPAILRTLPMLLSPALAAADTLAVAQTIAENNFAPKTRADVEAELAAAHEPGGALSVNPNQPLYPEQFSLGGYTVPIERADADADAARDTAHNAHRN